MLLKCLWEVDLEDLFVQQRKEENLRRIVRRAKALLAADESFFGEKSANKRLRGKETHDRVAKSFVREFVRPEPESVLTVTDCFERFNVFCEERGLESINRRAFKSMIAEVIREEFNLALRHDVLGKNMRQQQGWKGLEATAWRN